MLEIRNLSKSYGVAPAYEALKAIDFSVSDGEFVGIMGPSGSGKSTLLNLIATIDRPTEGEILLDNLAPLALDEEALARFRREKLGFVFQNFNLMPTLTVEENIVMPLTLAGAKLTFMQTAVAVISQKLGITDLLKKRISEISGGQAQRVAIARAMVHRPALLLADEPTGNLDTKASRDVMRLLRSLNQTEGATILMVTHDTFAACYCQRLLFIKDGQLLQEIVRGPRSQQAFYASLGQTLQELEGTGDAF